MYLIVGFLWLPWLNQNIEPMRVIEFNMKLIPLLTTNTSNYGN